MVKDHTARGETCCCHMGYSFRLATRVLLYTPPHRQDNTYHILCYTSRGALAGMTKALKIPIIKRSKHLVKECSIFIKREEFLI